MTEYITVKTLMAIYKVSRTTVYKWIGKGLPVHKLGTSTRFKPEEAETWIKKNIMKTEV